METEWMLDELATGLQKLLCLGLDRQPASEVIPGTVQAWLRLDRWPAMGRGT